LESPVTAWPETIPKHHVKIVVMAGKVGIEALFSGQPAIGCGVLSLPAVAMDGNKERVKEFKQ